MSVDHGQYMYAKYGVMSMAYFREITSDDFLCGLRGEVFPLKVGKTYNPP